MSVIRKIVDSIARRLETSDFFRTVPIVPVVVEDHKDVETQITRALQSAGAFAMVSYQSAETNEQNVPGPYLTSVTFSVTVSEIPSVWRAKSKFVPSATEISEAVMRLIHHYAPIDENDVAIANGVLLFDGSTPQPNESFLQHVITFQIPLALSNEPPTR
jgi:hypothetical protein